MHKKLCLISIILFLIPALVTASDLDQASYRSLPDRLGQALFELTDRAANAESKLPLPGDVGSSVLRATSVSAVQRYFPMHDGDSKHYSWTSVNSSLAYHSDTFNGYPVFNEYDSFDGSKAVYGYSNDQLLFYGTSDSTGVSTLVFDSPLVLFDGSTISQGGTFRSITTGSFQGYSFELAIATVVTNAGTVTVPAGTYFDCRKVSMSMTLSISGTTETVELPSVWVLAPGVGKIKVGVLDMSLTLLGWAELTGGTVNGINVQDLAETDSPPVGYGVADQLHIGAVIQTEEKGSVEARWQYGGEGTTSAGDRVIWGHFYADPVDVSWGSADNPDLFVKIWFDHGGRIDINYFHVSVPDIKVYSSLDGDGSYEVSDRTTMVNRYVRHFRELGTSSSEINTEDGIAPLGYSQNGSPIGALTLDRLRIGAIINTQERGPVEAVWRSGGQSTTARGDRVTWGYFYADPADVNWGLADNPDLFVKIWADVSGRTDVNYFHVSVPDIEVYTDATDDGVYEQTATTVMHDRYTRHEFW